MAANSTPAKADDDKLVTVYHPTLPGIVEEVPAKAVDEWAEAGWRKTAPSAS